MMKKVSATKRGIQQSKFPLAPDPKPSTSKQPAPKKFVIPKRTTVSNDCLRRVPLDSHEIQHTVLPALHNSYWFPKESRSHFKYLDFYLVDNPSLSSKFDSKRKEMKLGSPSFNKPACSEKELSITYAFLPVSSEEEGKSLAKTGIHRGNSSSGRLGKPEMGVYLCRKSDVLFPHPILPGSKSFLLMCKLIPGRVHALSLEETLSESKEPLFTHDSFLCKEKPLNVLSTDPLTLFETLRVFVYEHNAEYDLQDVPRQILPYALIRYAYTDTKDSSEKKTLSVKPNLLWTGQLRLLEEGRSLGKVELHSNFANQKPYSLGSHLTVRRLVSLTTLRSWTPVECLLKKSAQGVTLWNKHEIKIENPRGTADFVSYFRLSMKESEPNAKMLRDLLVELRDANLGLLASLRGGTVVIMGPQSEFTKELGVPTLDQSERVLHCLLVSYRSLVTGAPGGRKDPFEDAMEHTGKISAESLHRVFSLENPRLFQHETPLPQPVPTPQFSPEPPPSECETVSDQYSYLDVEKVIRLDDNQLRRLQELRRVNPPSESSDDTFFDTPRSPAPENLESQTPLVVPLDRRAEDVDWRKVLPVQIPVEPAPKRTRLEEDVDMRTIQKDVDYRARRREPLLKTPLVPPPPAPVIPFIPPTRIPTPSRESRTLLATPVPPMLYSDPLQEQPRECDAGVSSLVSGFRSEQGFSSGILTPNSALGEQRVLGWINEQDFTSRLSPDVLVLPEREEDPVMLSVGFARRTGPRVLEEPVLTDESPFASWVSGDARARGGLAGDKPGDLHARTEKEPEILLNEPVFIVESGEGEIGTLSFTPEENPAQEQSSTQREECEDMLCSSPPAMQQLDPPIQIEDIPQDPVIDAAIDLGLDSSFETTDDMLECRAILRKEFEGWISEQLARCEHSPESALGMEQCKTLVLSENTLSMLREIRGARGLEEGKERALEEFRRESEGEGGNSRERFESVLREVLDEFGKDIKTKGPQRGNPELIVRESFEQFANALKM